MGSFQNRIMQKNGVHIQKVTGGKIISLYSGCGGMDIGFSLAGFTPVWANDIDINATRTYKEFFPNHTVTTGNLLNQEIPAFDDIDLVIGGPPCQGFSIAGKMDPNDPRSKHVWNFMKVVAQISPKGFVMENVKSLAVNARWQDLIGNLEKEANKLGYKTKLFLLNASHFGVPQARERMFLVGIKDGEIIAPKPTTKDNPTILRQIFKELPKHGEQGNNSVCTAKITTAKNPVLRKSPFAGMLFNGQGRPMNLDMPAMTLPASMGGNRTPIVDQHQIDNPSAGSWVTTYHNHLMSGGEPHNNVPSTLRRITVEEAAAIQTFPKSMQFYGTQTTKYRQIGNAVPPLLAYHVALAIKESLYSAS
jgi:DNA (cytosine-5)-methyltransferase 1